MIWKINFKRLLIILCLIPSIAQAEFRHFNNWTTKEQALYTGYATVSYIDYKQTKIALNHSCGCYQEGNPLYGKSPPEAKIIAVNVAILGLFYYSIGNADKDKFNTALSIVLASRTAIVIHNDSIGVSWRVAF